MSTNELLKMNCELYWAHLTKEDKLSKKFSVKLCNLSEAAVAALKGMGLKPKYNDEHEEYGKHITVRSKYPIPAFFAEDGSEVTTYCGNGTKAIATIKARPFTYEGRSGLTTTVIRLDITDFVELPPMEDKQQASTPSANQQVL